MKLWPWPLVSPELYRGQFSIAHFTVLGKGLVATAPMAVLLLPARGLRYRDRACRQLCRRLVFLGAGRWLAHALIGAGLLIGPANVGAAVLYMLLILWLTPLVKRQTYPRNPRPAPVAPPALALQPAQPAPVATRQAPATPLTIACPVCRAPTSLHDQGCPSCGLLFASRVPAALRSLERYAVLRPLSPGGMGSIYLAQARPARQLCVLKTLASVDGLADPVWQADAASCLAREADLLAQIEHPHIPRLIEGHSQGPLSYLALEYIPGPTVEQRLSHTSAQGPGFVGAPFPRAEALGLAARVAATLADLAALPRPLMHLDLKPANLILPPDGPAPMLVDFGSAAWVTEDGSHLTRPLALYGTPGYAAPEQYGGQASPRSDCYGLAATLYHMLTDDDPGAHPLTFPALTQLPADIAALLTAALDRDPERRPTLRALSADIERLAACAGPP